MAEEARDALTSPLVKESLQSRKLRTTTRTQAQTAETSARFKYIIYIYEQFHLPASRSFLLSLAACLVARQADSCATCSADQLSKKL